MTSAKRLLSLLSLVALSVPPTCSPAWAADPPPAVEEPPDTKLLIGKPAPFSGVLMAPGNYRFILNAANDGRENAIKLEQCKADRIVDQKAGDEKLAVSEGQRRACEIERAPPPVKPPPKPHWYETGTFGFVAGVVVTSALAITLAVAL